MKYLWIDTESTGLFDYTLPADALSQPRVCSVGIIFLNEDFSIDIEREFLIKPNGWVLDPDSEAAKVNGLTMEELERDGIPLSVVLMIYAQAIDEGRVIGGHNISHDCKLMRGELRRAGSEDRYMKTRTICTMKSARKIVGALDKRGRVKMPKLEEACAFFGIPQPEKHRALDDAKASLALCMKLREASIVPPIDSPYDKKVSKSAKKTEGPIHPDTGMCETEADGG